MIVVKLELWPFGVEANKVALGVAEIANDGTGTPDSGNYVAKLYKGTAKSRPWKQATVKRFPRLQLSAWDLLHRVMRKAIEGEMTDE